jgi:glycosyltransferase involved in cell wall biosynthesis
MTPNPARIRVCHITTAHRPLDDRIFYKECVSLAKAGYDVHLIACHDHDETVHGVHIHALPNPPNRLARIALWPFKALVKALTLPVGIFHFHDPELIPTGMFLHVVAGKTVIYDVHERVADQILTKEYIWKPLRRLISGTYRVIEILALHGIGIIESDMIEGRYRQPKQSIRNLPIIELVRTEQRTPQDFSGKPVLVYSGGVTETRGAFEMLRIARALRQRNIAFEMRIIGQASPQDLYERMTDYIKQNRLEDAVQFTGKKIPFEESLKQIRQSTLGLSLLHPIPNYRFALPIKVLEYMTYGLPVVTSDLPCSIAYVTSCDAGIVVKLDDFGDMVEKIMTLLADKERMLCYSRKGQNAVFTRLNWETESRLLMRFYERMRGKRREPDPSTPHRPRDQRAIRV